MNCVRGTTGRVQAPLRVGVVMPVLALAARFVPAQTIPAARTFTNAWRSAGYPGEPAVPDRIVDVRDHGALGNGSANDQPAVTAAIAALGGLPGVVYFPGGTYYMAGNLSLPAGIVLRGERPAVTTLRFETAGHCINILGTIAGGFQAIVSGYGIHSSHLVVTDGSTFQAGDYAEVHQDNDPAWSPSTWLKFGQLVRIEGVSGNTLTLRNPLRITYQAALNPQIRKVAPIMECGIENLKVERLVTGDAVSRDNRHTILLQYAARCWVRGVESYNGFGGHVALVYSTQCEVTGCYIHHAHDYDGGGSGYGTRVETKTGECLIENNIFQHLRHAMLSQASVNGNVHGYNYSRENYWVNSIEPSDLTGDIACHGNYVYANLFEGNICQHIWLDDSHGLNGPLNTFFRNRAELRGLNCSASQTLGQNYVGNEAFRNTYFFGLRPGDGYSPRGSDNFEHGNNTESDGLQAPGTGTLPDYSYYLGSHPVQAPPTPAWWDIADTLPTIGPPHTLTPAKNIPAYARHQAGGVMTVGPPSIARQPTDQVVAHGGAAVLAVEAYGTPAVDYAWFKNGLPLAGETNVTLTIDPARPEHAGTYAVRVSDDGGSLQSAEATLQVGPAPGLTVLIR